MPALINPVQVSRCIIVWSIIFKIYGCIIATVIRIYGACTISITGYPFILSS